MIYLDNAATTVTDPEVVRSMLPYFTENFGNPSSIYSIGNDTKNAIAKARAQVAGLIGARPGEIYFTSGGTESNNWAVTGALMALQKKPHLVVSAIEHLSVPNPCKMLEKMGCEVTYLPARSDGTISVETFASKLRPDTGFVSIMLANNEVGTIEPIRKLAEIVHEKGAIFHTDAVQAVGHIPVDVYDLGVDLLSGSAHKFGGPKGVGFLYVKDGIKLKKFMFGGHQQEGMRAGTENVPGIVGLGTAAEIAGRGLENRMGHIESLRNMLLNEIRNRIHGVQINGTMQGRLPGNINVSIPGIDAESLVIRLDRQDIFISTGAACSAGASRPSHVLKALGYNNDRLTGAIRISVSESNTIGEIEKVASVITDEVFKMYEASGAGYY